MRKHGQDYPNCLALKQILLSNGKLAYSIIIFIECFTFMNNDTMFFQLWREVIDIEGVVC